MASHKKLYSFMSNRDIFIICSMFTSRILIFNFLLLNLMILWLNFLMPPLMGIEKFLLCTQIEKKIIQLNLFMYYLFPPRNNIFLDDYGFIMSRRNFGGNEKFWKKSINSDIVIKIGTISSFQILSGISRIKKLIILL